MDSKTTTLRSMIAVYRMWPFGPTPHHVVAQLPHEKKHLDNLTVILQIFIELPCVEATMAVQALLYNSSTTWREAPKHQKTA